MQQRGGLDPRLDVIRGHAAEHGFHHVALDLARWSVQHSAALADSAKRFGLELPDPHPSPAAGLLAAVREKASAAVGSRPEPGVLLLRDLRDLHLAASENSLYREMLGQAAQALKDPGLLATVSEHHPQTLRQMRWTNTMVKTMSPQILSAL